MYLAQTQAFKAIKREQTKHSVWGAKGFFKQAIWPIANFFLSVFARTQSCVPLAHCEGTQQHERSVQVPPKLLRLLLAKLLLSAGIRAASLQRTESIPATFLGQVVHFDAFGCFSLNGGQIKPQHPAKYVKKSGCADQRNS